MMKRLSLYLMTALALSAAQFARAQGNAEANNLARQGAEAAKAQDWDKAVESFRKATALDHKNAPNLFAVLQQRAVAYVGQQQFQEAVEDFNEALKINPRDAGTHERRAYVEMKLSDFDKALADYSEAIKINPNEVRYYLLRSYIYEVKGDTKNAMADTDKVLKMDKSNAEAQSRKARLEGRASQSPATPPPGTTPTPVPPSQRKPK
jgi:tetratricopeptide (TPR) repeat protein